MRPDDPEREASDPRVGPSRLGQLAARSPRLAARVATNPSATPGLLRRLARSTDEAVQRAVVSHPRTPRDVALSLATLHPREFADGAHGASLLADPSARPPRANHLRARLSWSGAPSAWFDRASWHACPSVRRLAAALRPTLPDDFVARLARDPREDVRAAVARHAELPRRWRDALLADPAGAVRAAVAERDDLDDDVRAALARDPELAVRAAAARHPKTPPASLLRLATEGERALTWALVDNPATPADALAALVDPPPESWFDAAAIGGHVHADARVAASVLAHPSPAYRREVLLSLRVVADPEWRALLVDPDARVRHAIAFHPAAPAWALAQLARDALDLVRSAAASAPRTPRDALAALCRDPSQLVRSRAAENPCTTDDDRRALSADPAAVVRLGAARQTRDAAVLDALSRDADERVRTAVWANPATTPDTRATLALDPGVRWQLQQR